MSNGMNGPVIVTFDQVAATLGGLESATEGPAGEPLSADDRVMLGRALQGLRAATGDPGVMCAPNDQAAALLQTFLADYALENQKTASLSTGGLEAQFDTGDAGWVGTFLPWARSKLGVPKRAKRPALSDARHSIADKGKVALLGDWGTGLYGAPACANSIAREGDFEALVHLGDVYYSGSEREIKEHFLALWPTAAGRLSRACNSNHEMYSGGGPFFETTLPAFEQDSTVFVLENEHWVLAGIDTAYHDHDLDDDQTDWLQKLVADLRTDRKLILLSHHQPYSHFEHQGPNLVARLEPLLTAGRVFAWYWGHEHRLCIYDRHAAWGVHGRCAGHSGFPYSRDEFGDAPAEPLPEGLSFRHLAANGDIPVARVLDGANEYLGDKAEQYGPNGWMRLEFDGPHLREVALAPNGVALWENVLA